MSGGYSEDRTPGDRGATWDAYWATVPFVDGRHAAHEGARKRRAMRERGQCCSGDFICPAHETEAEARAEACDE